MKKVAGTLKLDQAQFRELEAFAKFGSDLDAATKLTIDRGRKNQEILKQKQYAPESVENQVAIIYASTNGFLDDVPVEKVKAFEKEYLRVMETSHRPMLDKLAKGKLEDDVIATMKTVAADVAKNFA
jgi:F-type H+-transporting ATPase subunit alpha